MHRQTRRRFLQGYLLALVGVLTGCGVAPPWAQPAARTRRIGFLGGTTEAAEAARIEAFRGGLGELGYVEGNTIAIEWRWAEGQFDRLPALAAELAGLGLEIIVAGGSISARAAKEATSTIPIVFAQDPDPVGSGLVASLARPGGNITGLSLATPDLAPKRVELLRETMPGMARLAAIGSPTTPGNAQSLRETERSATAFDLEFRFWDAPRPEDIDAAFQEAATWRPDAVVVLGGAAFILRRVSVAELALQYRLPAIFTTREQVIAGGLMGYSPNVEELYRRSATYVDKILKGASPAELPVEQPSTFDLVINLRTAQTLRLTIPLSVITAATELIQ
jgi:putative tryptophan/tyrosine transport system substrate-binding protein